MNDNISAILYWVFEEDRNQCIPLPHTAEATLEKLRNMLYNIPYCEKEMNTDDYG